MGDQPPDEYEHFVIEDVRLTGETLTLAYGGHIFGGIVRCLLDPNGVEDALRPGTEIFVRYHSEEATGMNRRLRNKLQGYDPSTSPRGDRYVSTKTGRSRRWSHPTVARILNRWIFIHVDLSLRGHGDVNARRDDPCHVLNGCR